MHGTIQIGVNTIEVKRELLNPKTQDVRMTQGMLVIAHVTNKKLRFMNSQTLTIEKVTHESVTITNGEDDNIKINTKDFHKFFYLGFCLTAHASQETFTDKYAIYDWHMMRNRAKYVALSRGTNVGDIHIS